MDEGTVYLSAFTAAEIRNGIAKLGPGRKSGDLERWLADLKRRFAGRLLPVDDAVLDLWGRIVGGGEAKGIVLPGINALFAATALQQRLTLVTRNLRDMARTGAALLNPWTDEHP